MTTPLLIGCSFHRCELTGMGARERNGSMIWPVERGLLQSLSLVGEITGVLHVVENALMYLCQPVNIHSREVLKVGVCTSIAVHLALIKLLKD